VRKASAVVPSTDFDKYRTMIEERQEAHGELDDVVNSLNQTTTDTVALVEEEAIDVSLLPSVPKNTRAHAALSSSEVSTLV
jgi:hypothetical protein